MGLAFLGNFSSALTGDEVTIKIDDGLPEIYKITQIQRNTILISPSEVVVKKIADAKKVELTVRNCTYASTCLFTLKGGFETLNWEFEIPLSEQFRDYLEKIR